MYFCGGKYFTQKTIKMEETINTDPIADARRYVANAEEIIQKKVCDAGFEYANAIINYCASLMPKPVCA